MTTKTLSNTLTKEEILNDYRLVCESREASLAGRKEVFMGKAKFGIFGDGKELAQIAMAKVFKNGDFRSGYYRDQTIMFALNVVTIEQYFAQLYAHPDLEADPCSAGRMMNSHFATQTINEDGSWKDLTKEPHTTADLSPTAAQIPRLMGLAYASKLYRNNPRLKDFKKFSNNGNEIAFGTIGNASTSEGIFLEAINAAGVLQIPVLMSVWDDDYGISVPQKYHTTKESISKALAGFQRNEEGEGWEILTVRGWDYISLIETYQKAEEICRKEHVPVLVHVVEMTQPQGHSTSGSHERYKSKERLQWEKEYDCIVKLKEWILAEGIATEEELELIGKEAKNKAKQSKNKAWKAYTQSIRKDLTKVLLHIEEAKEQSKNHKKELKELEDELKKTLNPLRNNVIKGLKKALRKLRTEHIPARDSLLQLLNGLNAKYKEEYNSHLYGEGINAAINISEIKPIYDESSKTVDGREVLQACFDAMLSNNPLIFAIGEDVGKIGDVNQAFAGLQEKHGEFHVTDTGIRESTIIGQGIGAALRGLRPITEIQYLDYLLYALQTLSDDLACLHYRTKGIQKAPLIIRTRGHRLEGIWHSGSPIGMILHSLRGIYVLVPRNMTQAAGFYNTMLKSDDPAIIIESLNGYRLKEKIPANVGEFRVPLGIPEVLREGSDITIVTYGSMCRIVMDAAKQLNEVGIQSEVIDVQTLLPFDRNHQILESIKKTNRVIFADEDVPGGASAYMMQKVIEEQKGYFYLDSQPRTLSAKAHRPAYASDGDYFSKPSVEDVFDLAYEIMEEVNPTKFPPLYL